MALKQLQPNSRLSYVARNSIYNRLYTTLKRPAVSAKLKQIDFFETRQSDRKGKNSNSIAEILENSPEKKCRYGELGKSFIRYATTMQLIASNPKAPNGDLEKLRETQITLLSYIPYLDGGRQYHVPSVLLKRFEELEVPKQFHNLAAIENINEYSDEEIKLLVQWKSNECRARVNSKLVGANLVKRGSWDTLLLLSWLGFNVLQGKVISHESEEEYKIVYENWKAPEFTPTDSYKANKAKVDDLLLGYKKLEKAINYKFKNRLLLLQAVTHKSFIENTVTPANTQLSFLGDAVLEQLITTYLFQHPNNFDPGQVNQIRSVLGCNLAICNAMIRSQLYKYFRYIDSTLEKIIIRHVKWHKIQKFEIQTDCYIINEKDGRWMSSQPPHCLADYFEAILGAVFLDSNYSLSSVWNVLNCVMGPEIDLFCKTVPTSPMDDLRKIAPSSKITYGLPTFVSDSKLMVVIVQIGDYGSFEGFGYEHREARWAAATNALKCIKSAKIKL